jgi:integrase
LFGGEDAHKENTMRRKPSAEMLFDNMDDKHEGTVIRKPGSKKLYVLFYYYGRRVEKTTGLDDTPINRKKIKTWLDRQMVKIETNRFVFAEAFPSAASTEKAWFARQEGWDYQPEPKDVLFGDYVTQWYLKVWEHFPVGTKKDDWKSAINYWLLPHFEEMSFYQICGTELKNFISTIKWKSGSKKGQLLSKKRVKNILVPFRAIFNDACEEFRWNLPDPFRNTRKHLPDTEEKEREVFRYDDWQLLLKHMDPWYVPIVEFMILTGTISSEIAGLRKSDIRGNHILIQNTIVRNREKQKTKTKFRSRKIPITLAIRQRLDVALSRSPGDYVFTKPTGQKFNAANFNNNIWIKTFIKAELSHKVPYCMRHSFAAWSLTLKVDMLRLVSLMGHKDKKMVFEVYGKYVDGLEQDAENILTYFGSDFIAPELKQHTIMSLQQVMMQQTLMQQLAIQMQQPVYPAVTA